MKYIIDIPHKYETDWVVDLPLLGKELYVPLISNDKKYYMPTDFKLIPYIERLERIAIETEVWELARKIECMNIGEIEEAFGISEENSPWLFNQMNYRETKAKYEKWEKIKRRKE